MQRANTIGWYAILPSLAVRPRWSSCWCAQRGQALTQEPRGNTLRNHARRKASPQRFRCRPNSSVDGSGRRPRQGWRSCLPSGAQRLAEPPCGGEGARGILGTGRAQRRRCLPCVPPGGQRGEARRSLYLSALPRRRGARTSPGSSARGGGSPAAQRPFERGCTDRSADRCADRHTDPSVRARAFGGLDAAEALPRRCISWRSCGRRWSGPLGPRDRTTLPPQRRAGWAADCGAARCPWETARARAPATALRQRLVAPVRAAPGRCLARPRRR
jgi:hypothetical protein